MTRSPRRRFVPTLDVLEPLTLLSGSGPMPTDPPPPPPPASSSPPVDPADAGELEAILGEADAQEQAALRPPAGATVAPMITPDKQAIIDVIEQARTDINAAVDGQIAVCRSALVTFGTLRDQLDGLIARTDLDDPAQARNIYMIRNAMATIQDDIAAVQNHLDFLITHRPLVNAWLDTLEQSIRVSDRQDGSALYATDGIQIS